MIKLLGYVLITAFLSIADSFYVEVVEPTTMYIAKVVNERNLPDTSGDLIKTHNEIGEEVTVTGIVQDNKLNSKLAYVQIDNGNYLPIGWLTTNKPVNVQLPVSNIMQNPDLPNGCEVTSLTIVMNYKGYAVDKCDMSDNYLPKWGDLSGDPEYYYLREPRSNGFYCYATAICTTIDNYNNANETSIEYANLTGSDVSALYEQIDNGNPCVVWGTLRWNNPVKYSNGLYGNLHCMVLSGYTDTTVTITDPIYGDTVIDRAKFERVWAAMGSRAVVVTK